MTDDDIYAFHPPPHASPAAARRPAGRRRSWPWLLLAVLVLLALAAAIAAVAVTAGIALSESARQGWVITVNGERWTPGDFGFDLHSAPELLAVGAALMVAVLALLVVVPLSVLLALSAAAVGVGIALLAAAAVVVVALSPLWLVVALVWLVLRPRRPATAPAAGGAR